MPASHPPQRVTLLPKETLGVGDDALELEVLLPPSYAVDPSRHYPVLYCQDGQALWSGSRDPFGVWSLDTVLAERYALGAIEEVVVVGIHTSVRRIERLSPVPDPKHGGGGGPAHLARIVDRLVPHINTRYRTKTTRRHTALLGSSMGGLFSFYAAWARPDVFGQAACLSSSFWWANRYAVRLVKDGAAPNPHPVFYLDSGAALDPKDKDENARDGVHDTRSMFRALTARGFRSGVDLHRLVFTGHRHDAPSWSARASVPLQLLFPTENRRPEERLTVDITTPLSRRR